MTTVSGTRSESDETGFQDLLRERLECVDREIEALGAEIRTLRARERDLATQRGHLAALLGLDPAPPPASEGNAAPGGSDRGGQPSVADRVVALLEEEQEPLHYREIERKLRSRGLAAGRGRDPANTLLSRYFNDPRLYRPRRGTYDLRSRDPEGRSVGTRRRAR